MSLTNQELQELNALIPQESNSDPLYDRGYHNSKIERARSFNPNFAHAEAWAISMYLGPVFYYQGINKALANSEINEQNRQFLLIAKAATLALEKLPSVTEEQLQNLCDQNSEIDYEGYLLRYVNVTDEAIARYQNQQIICEPRFTSTTFWSKPVGMVEQYARKATLVFKITFHPSKSAGKYVDPIKRTAREGEILFLPNTSFRVESKQFVPDFPVTADATIRKTLTVIELTEMV